MSAKISFTGEDGKVRYTGHREHDGAAPEEVLEKDGRAIVECDEGHIWNTYIN